MIRPFFTKLWVAYLGTLLIGLFLHFFFAFLQENVYGEPNSLMHLEAALGNQVSATSYCIVLYMSSAWMLVYIAVAEYLNFLEKPLGVIGLYSWPIIPMFVYDIYEYYQMLNPTYVDNHILDFVMSWAACVTIWVITSQVINKIKNQIQIL